VATPLGENAVQSDELPSPQKNLHWTLSFCGSIEIFSSPLVIAASVTTTSSSSSNSKSSSTWLRRTGFSGSSYGADASA